MLLGDFDGPEKVRFLVPVRLPVGLPQVSWAVSVTLNAAPAVWGLAALAPIWWFVPALTVMLPEVPLTCPGWP